MNEKPLGCTLTISKAPLLILGNLISPPPRPTTCQHETQQHRMDSGEPTQHFFQLPPSTPQPHHPAAPWVVLSLLVSPMYMFYWEGGQEVCGWCSNSSNAWRVKLCSTSQGIWWLRKKICCPLPESDSLIMVDSMNLKEAGERISACLQLAVTVVYI